MRIRQICDVLADDLEANVDLPPHHRWRYTDPILATPELAPMLVVAPRIDDYDLDTTEGGYVRSRSIRIDWMVDGSFGAQSGGTGVEELAAAEVDRVDDLIDQAKTWATALPGIGPQVTATLANVSYRGIADGLLWRAEITVDVEELV